MFVCTFSEHVFFQGRTGPALCEPAASVVSALESVLTGIDVLVFGVVLGACAEQLHWAITEQSQSSNAIASIVWPDVQSLYCSLQFSEADSGKAGRRASVLQALLSACLRSAESMRRSSLRYAVSEDGIYDLRILRPTRCQLRYHRPVHMADSPMLGPLY